MAKKDEKTFVCDGYWKYGKRKVCRKGCRLTTKVGLPSVCVEYTEYYQGGKHDGAATFCTADWKVEGGETDGMED